MLSSRSPVMLKHSRNQIAYGDESSGGSSKPFQIVEMKSSRNHFRGDLSLSLQSLQDMRGQRNLEAERISRNERFTRLEGMLDDFQRKSLAMEFEEPSSI